MDIKTKLLDLFQKVQINKGDIIYFASDVTKIIRKNIEVTPPTHTKKIII